MSKYISIFIIAIFAVFLSACETDFNPNAEYKDITVVYGLLNQSDTFTYIKINKAFLGDASAYVMAQNEDFSSYGNDLTVTMDEMLNGSLTKTFTFDTSTVYNKESGIFYAPRQILYRCLTLNQLNQDAIYQLKIKNKKSGKIISAQTSLVNRFDITRPAYNPQGSIEFSALSTAKSKIEWFSTTGGKKYQVNMRVNYFESFDGANYNSKFYDINLGTITRKTLESGTEMLVEYSSLGFYESLKNNLKWSSDTLVIFRKPGKIEFQISVAADDLSTYIEVNEASNSIVQVRPEFSNISNGIGIFSARYNTAIDHPRKLDLGSKSRTILHEQYPMLGF
jgi:hypothetical protein